MSSTKGYSVGTKLKVTHSYGHDFVYNGVVVAVDEHSVTIKMDDNSNRPLRCVPTAYSEDHFLCEDERFLDFDIVTENHEKNFVVQHKVTKRYVERGNTRHMSRDGLDYWTDRLSKANIYTWRGIRTARFEKWKDIVDIVEVEIKLKED